MQRICLTHLSKVRVFPLRATSRQIRTMATYKATWEGTTVAEADKSAVERVDGNIYFPPSAIKKAHFAESPTRSTCGWKGLAHYYTISVDGKENKDAAWYYPDAKEKAKKFEGYVAFWKGVKVSE